VLLPGLPLPGNGAPHQGQGGEAWESIGQEFGLGGLFREASNGVPIQRAPLVYLLEVKKK